MGKMESFDNDLDFTKEPMSLEQANEVISQYASIPRDAIEDTLSKNKLAEFLEAQAVLDEAKRKAREEDPFGNERTTH